MPITIENTSMNIKGFVARYRAWHQAQLVNNPNKISAIDWYDQGQRIRCFSDRDIEQINACTDKVVMIDSLNEGLHYISVYDNYDKNKHYLLFAPWFDQRQITLPISYTPIWYSHLLFEMVEDYTDPKSWYYYIDRTYTFDYPKPCLLTTIAGHGPERELIKNVLIDNLEKEDFVFRYNSQDFGRSIDAIDIADTSNSDFVNVHQAFEKRFIHIQKQPGYVYWKLVSMAAHNMSYFNLVLESDVTRSVFFLTEKTVKPLLIGQPFVIHGSLGFLQHLKNLGFSTFGDLWDESYDQEPDYKKRAEMVAQLCIRLKDFDWASARDQLQAICTKNQLRIHNLSAVAQREFQGFESTIQALCLDK